MHLYFTRNRQSRNKQTNKTKYTAKEINTIPAATLRIPLLLNGYKYTRGILIATMTIDFD